MLVSIHRTLGRRVAGGAVALALTLPFGAVATAAPAAKKAPAAATTAPPPAPATAGSKSAPAAAPSSAVPEPPPPSASEPAPAIAGLTVLLPVEVSGSLSKDSRRALASRLQFAAAAAKVTSGAYRLRLSLRVSKKKDFALTLTVVGADDAQVGEHTAECKACSIADVEAHVDALVQQAEAALAPKEPLPPAPVAVAVSSAPAGARVRVDGAEQGLTPTTIELLPGEHTVLVDKPGFLEHSQTITVEPGVEQQLAVTLTAQPPQKGRKRSRGAKGPASAGAGRGLLIGGGVLLGLGVAGIATGVAMILIDEDPMPQRCSGADMDFRGVCRYRYDTLMGGIIGVAAGGVGLAGGVAMMIKGRQISVRARADKQQASLGVSVRF